MKRTKSIFKIWLGILLAVLSVIVQAQSQKVKGIILDKEAEFPLIGATVIWVGSDPVVGTVTDINGSFTLSDIPVGRHSFQVSYVGYKNITLPNVLVTSGKEVILEIKLEESVEKLSEIVVTAASDKDQPINEMAKVSARTFSLEEVTRFSGGRNDVARLATSFAGVSAPDDSRNDIVVRGNSPTGLLWRVEGLPVATTNHFAALGTTGGPVNALNTNLLRTSDFLTGAFPTEYGNANSAVFDVQFRNGNPDTYEFTGQMGFNGAEFMAEGPLNRSKNGSFLASYRYGVAGIAATGTSAIPYYQDFAFKVNLGESRLGRFEFFGMGGVSSIDFLGDELDENDLFADPNVDSFFGSQLGVVGVSHVARFSKNSYLKTTLGASTNGSNYTQNNYVRDDVGNKIKKFNATDVENQEHRYTLTSSLTHKFNARWNMKAGFLSEMYVPSFQTRDRDNRIGIPDENADSIPDFYITVTDMEERYLLNQLFSQAEYKFTDDLSLTFGIHSQYFSVNDQVSFEPRVAVSWQATSSRRFSIAYGKHVQTLSAPLLFYEQEVSPGIYKQTNSALDFSKSHHFVAGVDQSFAGDWRLKVETYYQYLYDVPVESISSSYSVLNEGSDFVFSERGNLINKGTAQNYGLELTLEKFYSRGYYTLITGSLFESTYEGSDGIKRSTAFNTQRVANVLAGKEWSFGKKKQNAFTLDTKFTTSGGRPYTEIDVNATRANAGRQILREDQAYELRYADYLRWDVKLGVRLNKPGKKISQQFYVDLQNITNKENEFERRYNRITDEVNLVTQIGFFPDVLYRIQF